MRSRLTNSLIGEIDLDLPDFQRISNAIVTDSLLYSRVMQKLVADHAPDIIAEMHPLERAAFLKRIKYVPPAATIGVRIQWGFIPAEATKGGERPLIQAKRFFGNSQTCEETMFWRPIIEAELATIKEPWTGSCPPPEVLELFRNFLVGPDPHTAAILRENQRLAAEAAAKQQGQNKVGDAALSDPLSVAINLQKAKNPGLFVDNSGGRK